MGCSISKTVVYTTLDGKDYIESSNTLETNTPIRRKSNNNLDHSKPKPKPVVEVCIVMPTNKDAKQYLVTTKENPVYLLTYVEFLAALRDDVVTENEVALYISRNPECLFIQDEDGRTAVDYATLYHNKKRTLLFVNTKLNYRIARDAKRFMVRVVPVNE